jgi:hypothetical protein
MLDGMRLSDKLEIARQWFERSVSGEFAFTDRHRETFVKLLVDCKADAAKLEPSPDPATVLVKSLATGLMSEPGLGAAAEPVYLPDEFRHQGIILDDALAPNVLPFERAVQR